MDTGASRLLGFFVYMYVCIFIMRGKNTSLYSISHMQTSLLAYELSSLMGGILSFYLNALNIICTIIISMHFSRKFTGKT